MVAVYYVVAGCYCGCGVLCVFRVLLSLRCTMWLQGVTVVSVYYVVAGCYCGCGVLL